MKGKTRTCARNGHLIAALRDSECEGRFNVYHDAARWLETTQATKRG
jgi:hypothetical protein